MALTLSAAYLYGYPSATISYGVLDFLHIAAGLILSVLLAVYLLRKLRGESFLARLGWILLSAGAVLGILLIKV